MWIRCVGLLEDGGKVPLTRRQFLKGMGAVAGGIGAASGIDYLIPYVEQPIDNAPGTSIWYATSCRECPAGCAMVVRNLQSRAVKCEGNPLNPVNAGSLCARGQAALHGLYDPDRISGPLRRNDSGSHVEVSWHDAFTGAGDAIRGGKRIALFTGLETNSLAALMRAWLGAVSPGGRLLMYSPVDYAAVKAMHGGVVPWFNIGASDLVISFAADFLETWISPIEYARDFAAMRNISDGHRGGFIYIGPRLSMTAANADLRLLVPPGVEMDVAYAIASAAGRPGVPAGFSVDDIAHRHGLDPRDILEAGRRLAAARAPLALPGWHAEAAQAASFLNAGMSAGLIDAARPHAVTALAGRADISNLVAAMENGGIDVLIVNNANPLYSLHENLHFDRALANVPVVISTSSYMDETTARANWVLPSNTPLESWGDYSPYPDVINSMQPATGIIFDTQQTGDILLETARFAGIDPVVTFGVRSYYEFIRKQWGFPAAAGTAAPAAWESILQRGGRWPNAPIAGATPRTGYQADVSGILVPVPIASRPAPPAAAPTPVSAPAPIGGPLPAVHRASDELILYAYPHIYFYDGSLANRRWLQELPTPVVKGAWTSWADISPATAHRLGIDTDDILEVTYRGVHIKVPVNVYKGMANDTIAIAIGQGHTHYGRYARDRGVNVLSMLDIEHPVVVVKNTGDNEWFTRMKGSTNQHGRKIVQTTELGNLFKREEPIIMPLREGYGNLDFYPGHDHTRHRWAMTVDLNKCIGCHACAAACIAENNNGETSAEDYYRRREMFWLRIDRYIDWEHKTAPVLFQPMFCQHCDAAPCEPVCPVYAAVHSEQEGVNEQIYNRCVGTRYCSNNCPYKVRRFNWFDYEWPEPLNWQLNPDVTVRRRGVMEKCTFCIQRIRQAEIVALREGRAVADGDVTPACVETCPTGVFTFGDLMDSNSRVSKIINTDPRAYQVLRELNTKTGVIYLKRVVDKA